MLNLSSVFGRTTKMQNDRNIIGYTLEPIYETARGAVVTQAFIMCHSCDAAISVNGGPRYNAICVKCAEHLNFINLVKGN